MMMSCVHCLLIKPKACSFTLSILHIIVLFLTEVAWTQLEKDCLARLLKKYIRLMKLPHKKQIEELVNGVDALKEKDWLSIKSRVITHCRK